MNWKHYMSYIPLCRTSLMLMAILMFGCVMEGRCSVKRPPVVQLLPISDVVELPSFSGSLSLPDSPSTSSAPSPDSAVKCGPKWMGGCWDLNHRNYSWKENFTSPSWYWPMLGWIAADVYDAEMTHEGLAHHHCHEGAEGLAGNPSRGQLYLYEVRNEAPLWVMNYFIHKLNRKGTTIISIGQAGAAMGVHIHGGTGWAMHCW